MKAIQTKYHGPTNTRGSRITASAEGVKSLSINYPHEFSGMDAHAQAALALCKRHGWNGKLVGGGLKDSYVFCFAESYGRDTNRYEVQQ